MKLLAKVLILTVVLELASLFFAGALIVSALILAFIALATAALLIGPAGLGSPASRGESPSVSPEA